MIRKWRLMAAACTTAFLLALPFPMVRVVEGSMAPGLPDGALVVGDVVPQWLGRLWPSAFAPKAGQIVLFWLPGRPDLLIKRVVGIAGDHIRITQGMLFRNGNRVLEPYLGRPMPKEYRWPALLGSGTGDAVVSPGSVFVLGDNRSASVDSRMFGDVPIANVVGVVACKIP
jgi:signal peptidase I